MSHVLPAGPRARSFFGGFAQPQAGRAPSLLPLQACRVVREPGVSIRTRLLLLVLAVWLPAVAGFGLLARATYLREADAAIERIQQLGRSLNGLVERELDKRVVLAGALGASSALLQDDLARFHQEASVATSASGAWAFVVERERQLANTRHPFGTSAVPRLPDAPWSEGEPQVVFTPSGPRLQQPVVAVFVAPRGPQPPRLNVGVAFEPAVVQAVVDQQRWPEGGVATVMDQQQRVIARNRDPLRWLGSSATGDVLARAKAGRESLAETVTLDGVPSLTYLTAPNRYGWSVVIGLPLRTLNEAARRVTLQAVAASGVLLLLGLGLAVVAANRIGAPLLALRDSAARLGAEEVPPELHTGVSEVNQVGRALHVAGQRLQQSAQEMAQRVAQAVAQAEQAQAKLLEGQKHEAIGRLTGGLAHDFNNLLQTIMTGLQLVNRSAPEGPQRRVVQAALRASGKAADLVRQMQTFGRSVPLQPQPVSLADQLLKSRELASKALGDRVQLVAAVAPDMPTLFVDPSQLELALLNLVFNARDAMPDGGTVQVIGRPAHADETLKLPPGRYACLEVVDNGSGMDARTLEQAAEPYFTTKPVGAGSGLGLAQVHAFARRSGGDIRLQSTPGSGSTVTLILPTSELSPAPQQPDAPPPAPLPMLRILMAEDDMLVSSVVVPALEHAGHQVKLCGSADEARARLLTGEAFDLLFTDVVMPGMLTGIDLADWCRTHRPGLPVVLATGYSAQPIETDARVLRKPYAVDAMLDAIARAVRP